MSGLPVETVDDNVGNESSGGEDLVSLKSRLSQIIQGKKAPMVGNAEAKLIVKLEKLKREAERARRSKSKNWDTLGNMYAGNQYPRKLPSYRIEAITNLILPLVEHKTALLTDSKPKINIVPTISQDAPAEDKLAAERLGKTLENVVSGVWEEHCINQRLARLATYCQVFGCGGVNTTIETNRQTGKDPTLRIIDPRNLCFDPFVFFAEDLELGEYCIYSEVKSTNYLKANFPQAAHKIKPDARYYSSSDSSDYIGGLLSKIRSMMNNEGTEHYRAVDRAVVDEYWVKPYMYDDEPDIKALFGNIKNGGHVLVSNRRIIHIGENPYDDGQFPFDFMDWHMDLNSLYGIGDVELYQSPQVIYNKLISLLVENAALMTNSIWIGDNDAMAKSEWKKLVNEPGAIIRKRPNRELRREPPPPLSAGLFNTINMIIGSMDKLSSISPAVSGQNVGQIRSGEGVNSLQIAGQTPIRFEARAMESLLSRSGQKLISRIFQFMPDDRIFTITGDGNQVLTYHFKRKEIRANPSLSYRDFIFHIQPGSSLATNKMNQGMLAMQMAQMGFVDRQDVFDKFDYPNKEEIQRRMAEKEAAMLEAGKEMQDGNLVAQGLGAHGGNRGSSGAGGRTNNQLPATMTKVNQGE